MMNYIRFILLQAALLLGYAANSQCDVSLWYTPLSNHSFQFNSEVISLPDTGFSYSWALGTGDTLTLQNPQYTFTDTGNYNVCVHVSNNNQTCQIDTCLPIHVDTCQAYFTYTYTPELLQPEEPIYFFMDSSFGEQPGTTFLWEFGTGDYSTQQNQAFVYETDDAGPEDVCLTVFTPDSGCISTYCHTIIVDALCGADTFAYTVQGNTVNFTSWICGYWANIDWDFGDGNHATQQQTAQHTYINPADSFYVCLTVNFDSVCREGYACTAIYCQQVKMINTGIHQFGPDNEGVNVSPNPAISNLLISVNPNNTFTNFRIVTAEGRVMYKGAVNNRINIDVQVENLPPGVYWVLLYNDAGERATAKWMKQ